MPPARLLPFYPTPGRDDGTTSPTMDINGQFGTMRDFRRFMQEAKRRDLRAQPRIWETATRHAWQPGPKGGARPLPK